MERGEGETRRLAEPVSQRVPLSLSLPQLCGKINFTITRERVGSRSSGKRLEGGKDEITGRGAIASRL